MRAAPIVAYYEATWASLPAATMIVSIDRDGLHYRDGIHVETVGLPRWLLHFRTRVDADGMLGPDGAARPAHYSVDYDLRRYRDQRIRLKFVARDGAVVAERTDDDSSKKPPLAENFRRDAIDPMSAFAAIREHVRGRAIKVGDRFTLPVFDDVRRFDAAVTVVKIDEPAKLVDLHIDLLPIAGFKDPKPNAGDQGDTPRPIEMTFRNDAVFFPIRLEVAVGWVPLVIRFDHFCADAARCTAEKSAKK